MKKKYVLGFLCLILACFGGNPSVFAAEVPLSERISVKTALPENQNKITSYFDLTMEPKQKQTINFTIKNTSDQDIELIPKITTASTSARGNVNYLTSDESAVGNVTYRMEEIVTFPETVTVKQNSEAVIPATIQMPEEELLGIMVGGISVVDTDSEEEMFLMSLILSEKERNVIPNLLLGDLRLDTKDGQVRIVMPFENPKASFINQLQVTAEVKSKDQKTTYATITKDGMQMAPNSHFELSAKLRPEQTLAKGEYVVAVTAKGSGMEWQYELPLTVSDAEVQLLTTNLPQTSSEPDVPLFVYVMLGVVGIGMVILVFSMAGYVRVYKRLQDYLEYEAE